MSLSPLEEARLRMMIQERESRGSCFGVIVFAITVTIVAFLLHRTVAVIGASIARLERLEKIHNLPYTKPWHDVQIRQGEYEGLGQTK